MKTPAIIFLVLAVLHTVKADCQVFSRLSYESGAAVEIGSGADVCADSILINGTYSGTGTICNGTLPVELASFMFSVNRNSVTLSWSTAHEMNNSVFDIERLHAAAEGMKNWEHIGFVKGSGTSEETKTYSYEDKKLKSGSYRYRLKQIDYNGNFEYFELNSDVIVQNPSSFSISQNYPNPSNPKSRIDFEIPEKTNVNIKIYNLLGEEVLKLMDEVKEAGYHSAEIDGSNIASGVYFYVIQAGKFKAVKKMILLK